MPELPDVVIYIEALETRVTGEVLERVRLSSPFVLRTAEPAISEAEGRRVLALRRVGKRIALELEGELRLHVPLVPVCGNRRCVNPHHMVPADPRKGSAMLSPRGSFNRSKTHCRHGHAYSGFNLVIKRDGRRRCRRCHADQARVRRWRRRQRLQVPA